MITVHLYGRLKRTAPGGPFDFYVRSVPEVVRALAANFPGEFPHELAKGQYKIVHGPPKGGTRITRDMLTMNMPAGPLHIIPVTGGAKSQGTGKIIMGVALLGLGVAGAAIAGAGAGGLMAGMSAGIAGGPVSWGAAALFGASLAATGVAMNLSAPPPMPHASSLEPADQRNSWLLGTPTQTAAQGQPVPIIGGRMRVGSLVASAGVLVEQLPAED